MYNPNHLLQLSLCFWCRFASLPQPNCICCTFLITNFKTYNLFIIHCHERLLIVLNGMTPRQSHGSWKTFTSTTIVILYCFFTRFSLPTYYALKILHFYLIFISKLFSISKKKSALASVDCDTKLNFKKYVCHVICPFRALTILACLRFILNFDFLFLYCCCP